MQMWRYFYKAKKERGWHPASYLTFAKYFYALRRLGLVTRTKREPASIRTAIPRQYYITNKKVPEEIIKAHVNWSSIPVPSLNELVTDVWHNSNKYLFTRKKGKGKLIDFEKVYNRPQRLAGEAQIPPEVLKAFKGRLMPHVPQPSPDKLLEIKEVPIDLRTSIKSDKKPKFERPLRKGRERKYESFGPGESPLAKTKAVRLAVLYDDMDQHGAILVYSDVSDPERDTYDINKSHIVKATSKSIITKVLKHALGAIYNTERDISSIQECIHTGHITDITALNTHSIHMAARGLKYDGIELFVEGDTDSPSIVWLWDFTNAVLVSEGHP